MADGYTRKLWRKAKNRWRKKKQNRAYDKKYYAKWYKKNWKRVIAYTKEWQWNNPKKHDEHVAKYRKSPKGKLQKRKEREKYMQKYGQQYNKKFRIARKKYHKLLKKQKYRCGICKLKWNKGDKRFCLDHCHKTGKIRGLLCTSCNSMIGFAKDRIKVLKGAIKYLRIYKKG